MHKRHDYDGKVQKREYQAGELVWTNDEMLGQDQGKKLQFPWLGPFLITKLLDQRRVVVRRKREKPLAVVHVDRFEMYKVPQGRASLDGGRTTRMHSCLRSC